MVGLNAKIDGFERSRSPVGRCVRIYVCVYGCGCVGVCVYMCMLEC